MPAVDSVTNATVLIVGDEPIGGPLAERLKADGCRVVQASTSAAGLDQLANGVDLVLLDYRLPDTDAITFLRQIKDFDQDIVVILLAADTTLETVREAMKRGAFHVANKPFDLDEVAATVRRALETARLRREIRHFRSAAARPYTLHSLVGNSPAMTALRHRVARIAISPGSTVLLTGEPGTGKDLVARIIHYAGERSARTFLSVTCSALPEHLLERELFGHERGAFTGASRLRRGALETADGGTVFLDDVAAMPPALQTKLLRFFSEKSFRRVGGSTDVTVDVRIVAAANRDLDDEVNKGRFQSDLYGRLNVLRMAIPPLRERSEDVPLLVEYFIDRFNPEVGKHILGASTAAYASLQRYPWPGNVRELRNVVERAMLLTNRDRLEAADFEALVPDGEDSRDTFELPAGGVDLDQLERSLVGQALHRCAGNQTRAAALLGLNRDQIRYRVEKFGLSKPA
jgi:two-component system, NtrC family, response regulator AtoC